MLQRRFAAVQREYFGKRQSLIVACRGPVNLSVAMSTPCRSLQKFDILRGVFAFHTRLRA